MRISKKKSENALKAFEEQVINEENFENVIRRIQGSFHKSKGKERLKERAKFLAEEETNLLRLLEMRELCVRDPDLLNLQQSIESFWEKKWTKMKENPQEIEKFLEKIEGEHALPYFAKIHIYRN